MIPVDVICAGFLFFFLLCLKLYFQKSVEAPDDAGTAPVLLTAPPPHTHPPPSIHPPAPTHGQWRQTVTDISSSLSPNVLYVMTCNE